MSEKRKAAPSDATETVKDRLREVGVQLSLLNHRLSSSLELRTVDLDCLNLIHTHGPAGIGELARRVGLHPATTTGIVDRLERAGWVSRERKADDRRAVEVHAVHTRDAELFALLAGMNHELDVLLAGYEDDDLKTVADFLDRVATAAREAAGGLSDG